MSENQAVTKAAPRKERRVVSRKSANKQPTARKDVTKLQWTWHEMKAGKMGYVLVAPFMFLFFMFTVLPVILSVFLSFTIFNMLEMPEFIGLDNYITLFLDDDIFLLALKNTIFFACITGPGCYLLSLIFAWFINELTPKLRAFVTLVFYAPSISGGTTMIWSLMFTTDQHGIINGLLMKYGFITQPIAFFQDPDYIIPLTIAISLWSSLGTSFLVFIAAFQTVNREMYEAGAMDGVKNRWQELWYITLPSMKNQMMFSAVMAITSSFNFGGLVSELAGNPSPDYCAHTLVHHLGDYGGTRMEMGYASTIAVILFAMMVGSNLLVQKLLSKVGK